MGWACSQQADGSASAEERSTGWAPSHRSGQPALCLQSSRPPPPPARSSAAPLHGRRYDEIEGKLTPFLRGCGYNPKKDLLFIPISGAPRPAALCRAALCHDMPCCTVWGGAASSAAGQGRQGHGFACGLQLPLPIVRSCSSARPACPSIGALWHLRFCHPRLNLQAPPCSPLLPCRPGGAEHEGPGARRQVRLVHGEEARGVARAVGLPSLSHLPTRAGCRLQACTLRACT